MKKYLKTVISSLFIIAGTVAFSVGATTALFTDNSETNIAVTAGKVKVESTVKNIALYSAWPSNQSIEGLNLEKVDNSEDLYTQRDEYNNLYYSKIMPGSTFETGGTAFFSNGVLSLINVAPGDKTEFSVGFTNTSNIDILYRLGVECLDEDDSKLKFFSNLEFCYDDQNLSNVKKFTSDWIRANANESIDDKKVTIKLPLFVGNGLQSLGCNIKIYAEALQANAYVSTGGEKLFVDFVNEKVEEDENDPSKLKDLTLQAGKAPVEEVGENKPLVQVLVPASNGDVVAYLEEEGQPVSITNEDTLTLKVEEKESGATFTLETNEKALNYEISLFNQDGKKIKSTSENMNVDVYVGKGREITRVFHKGVLISSENYSYDSNKGYVHIQTKDFSPFNVLYKDCQHVFGDMKITKTPTVDEEGLGEYECTKCGFIYQEKIDKHVHNYVETNRVHGNCCADGDEVTYTCSGCNHSYQEHENHDIVGSYCNTCHRPAAFIITNKDVEELLTAISTATTLNKNCQAYHIVSSVLDARLHLDENIPLVNEDGNINAYFLKSFSITAGQFYKLDSTFYYSPYSFERMVQDLTSSSSEGYKYINSSEPEYIMIETANGKEYRKPVEGENYQGQLYSEDDMLFDFSDKKAAFTISFKSSVEEGQFLIGGSRGDDPGSSFAFDVSDISGNTFNGETTIIEGIYYSNLLNYGIFICGAKNLSLSEGTKCTVNLYLYDSEDYLSSSSLVSSINYITGKPSLTAPENNTACQEMQEIYTDLITSLALGEYFDWTKYKGYLSSGIFGNDLYLKYQIGLSIGYWKVGSFKGENVINATPIIEEGIEFNDVEDIKELVSALSALLI